ncbi:MULTISPECIES: hypothetical protein [unclassified Bradyrhizobium]|uniref:hypothetical protein n=1 Tax=unclassified Bradyrhizobium TaxID=2631580 RepID=UPI003399AAC7
MALTVRKLPPRNLTGPGLVSQKVAQEKYFLRLVTNNPKFKLLIASLKSGVGPAQVAAHWAREGWIDVNERTFAEAIRAFRKVHPEAIAEAEAEGLDGLVEPNQPMPDELQAAMQLLKIQQLRLGIEVGLEKNLGKLFQTTVKDVEATTKLIETIGKLRGRINEGGRPVAAAEEAGVMEDLNRVKKDQASRDRMHNMVKQVVEAKG